MRFIRISMTAIAIGLVSYTSANACPDGHDLSCTSSATAGAGYEARAAAYGRHAHGRYTRHDGRPRSWCGWYMRQRMGIADRSFNLARNWTRWGSASGPRAGAIVIWRGHVGQIVSYQGGCTATVHSGNDAGAVRTRERNICNAIAFRG